MYEWGVVGLVEMGHVNVMCTCLRWRGVGKGEESGWMVGREGIECVRICVSSVISFSALIFIASFAWFLLASALVVFYSV